MGIEDLKSPECYVERFVPADNWEILKSPHYCPSVREVYPWPVDSTHRGTMMLKVCPWRVHITVPLWGKSIHGQLIPLTEGQWCWRCVHEGSTLLSLCEGSLSMASWFHSQRDNDAEGVSMKGPHYCPSVREVYPWPVDSTHRGTMMLKVCPWRVHITVPLWGKSIHGQLIPLTEGQWCWRCVHEGSTLLSLCEGSLSMASWFHSQRDNDAEGVSMKGPHYCPSVREVYPWPVDSTHRGTMMLKVCPCHDVLIINGLQQNKTNLWTLLHLYFNKHLISYLDLWTINRPLRTNMARMGLTFLVLRAQYSIKLD